MAEEPITKIEEIPNLDHDINKEKEKQEEEEHERQSLLAYIEEIEERNKRRLEARAKNINVKRPEESYFSKLDSSLKKNTAFVRKVKNFTASQLEGLLKDLKVLNLSKYVSEIASALTEAKLKVADVLPACELCCEIHRLYVDFENALLECWKKSLTIKSDEPITNHLKYKIDLKLFAELVLMGLWATPPQPARGLQLLGSILISLVHSSKEDFSNMTHILSFCRSFGEVYAGLVPREMSEASAKFGIPIPSITIIPVEKHRTVRQVFQDYYDSFCKHLIKNHNELQKFEKQSKTILHTKGELSSNRKAEYNYLSSEYQKLLDYARNFSEILNVPMPLLPVEEVVKSEDTVIDDVLMNQDDKSSAIWEDEDTQKFYECLPDLQVFVPHLLPPDASKQQQQPLTEITEEVLDQEVEIPAEELEVEKKIEEPEVETVADTKTKYMLNDFLTHLPGCCNRDTIDNMAIEFVLNLNTKHNRKKLARCLFGVNRTRLDLLPFYSRLVAIIHPVAPDVAGDLCHMLKEDFLFHIRKKDQINIETKIKVVRFIGELVKFKMYSKLEGLFCVKVLLQDFNHHHIEMVCNLLECCGRFLFNHAESRERTKVYLEQMMRKKSVMALDSRYVTMVENAFYAVIPREGGQTVRKERPPMHEFIRQILYQELGKQNVVSIIKLLHKVDWNDPDLSAYVIKCLVNAWNLKYFNIRTLAGLVADLSRYYENVQIEVVDGVLEDIRLCLEVMLPKYNQRRIAMVKYLGELYYYHMADSSDILKVLYLFISLGVTFDYNNPSPLDPPGHVFRLRLVCVLLETCGQYFRSGTTRKKLDYFLVFFQNYFWYKYSDPYWTAENPFPARLKHMVRDCLINVRPKMIIFHSYEESQEAVEELRRHFMSKIAAETKSTPSSGELNPIEEKDEGEVEFVDGNDEEGEEENNNNNNNDESSDEEDQTFEGSYPHSQSQGEEFPILPEVGEGEEHQKTIGLQRVECQEDEDFMSAFDKLVADQIQERMKERITPQQIDISVPLHIRASAKKTYEQLKEPNEETSTVNFILMLRKGNKHSYKSLTVPVMSELAMNLKEHEKAERMEKEKVKRLTLDINERLEEEDYQDMMTQSQRPTVSNLNRERRQKYQHPKGAPDADLIFGTGKGK